MFDIEFGGGCAVGSNSRYNSDRRATGREADEARALHTMGELVSRQSGLVLDRSAAGQLAEVMHAVAIELNAVRPVPVGVRRAVLGLANALRAAMDPRDDADAAGAAGSTVSDTVRPESR
jgi:hypothetical protein